MKTALTLLTFLSLIAYEGHAKYEDWSNRKIRFQIFDLRATAKLEEALALSEDILKYRPENAEAHFQRGVTLDFFGRYQDAMEALTLAIKYNRQPYLGEVYYHRGVSKEDLGNLEGALKDYKKAIELGYNERDVHFRANAILLKFGRLGEE